MFICKFTTSHILTHFSGYDTIIQIITRYNKAATSTTNEWTTCTNDKGTLWKDKATNDIIYNNWQIYTSPLAMQTLIHAPQHSPKVLHFASCNTNIMTSTFQQALLHKLLNFRPTRIWVVVSGGLVFTCARIKTTISTSTYIFLLMSHGPFKLADPINSSSFPRYWLWGF